jgi:Flp pilus assembly protein TadG
MMKIDQLLSKPRRALKAFRRSEDGSFTVEFVIWMPIFAVLLAIVMNLSMVFYYESQMLRVAQDATRAFSMGKFEDDPNLGMTAEELAEAFIADRLSFIQANLTIDTQIVGLVAQTVVSTNASELMPFSLMSGPFVNIPIGVSTQYMIEF